MINSLKNKCVICGKIATANCSKCGKPLCQDHIEHGISLRTNAPTIDCPSCRVKMGRSVKKTSIILSIIFILVAILIIFYLNSIFKFF